MKYFTLRDYQGRACNAVWRALENPRTDGPPFRRVILCAATGGGKTIMANALQQKWTENNRRSLFLADRDELVSQAVDKLRRSTGIIADIEQGKSKASPRSLTVVGSIQTMSGAGRLERFAPDHFHRIICDEAQGSMAPNWQRVLNRFAGGGAGFVGITATPERGDGLKLMDWWEHMAFEIPLKTLIERKHLSPIIVQTVPLEIIISGDAGEGEQEEIGDQLRAYHDKIIDAIETHAADRRKILIFHPSCNSSRAFTTRLLERGHPAKHIDGESKDRKAILAGYARGDFRILNNAQLLIQGYDESQIDCVIPLRPTRVRGSYMQMTGRGTRLWCPHGCSEWCEHPDRKRDMLLLDFLWQTMGHNLMGPAFLHTDNAEQAEAVAKQLREPGRRDLTEVDEVVFGEREERLINALRRGGNGRALCIDARGLGAVFHQPALMDYEPVSHWQRLPATPAQLSALQRMGVDPDSVKDKGHASALMEYLTPRISEGLASVKQLLILQDRGIPYTPDLSFAEASAFIGQKRAAHA